MFVSKEGNLVTLINVFETKPEQQQALIEQWIRFVDSVKGEPGGIGTALHRSTDGTCVVNYAQWRSVEDFERGCRRSTASTWRPFASSPSASTPICTKSSLSLSRVAVDRLSRQPPGGESMGILAFSRADRADGERAGQKGARIVWQSPIESLCSCASTTP
jgi:heme-degrading monooxygenase HmoA